MNVADKSMYEEMGDDLKDFDNEAPDSEMTEASQGASDDLDEEFRMHAEKAGMDTPEKLEAFKMAIERCVELQQEKSYAADAGDMGDETDEDAEI